MDRLPEVGGEGTPGEQWTEIRSRLEGVLKGIESSSLIGSGSDAESQMEDALGEDGLTEVVAFPLGNESYAVESGYLREVCSASGLTPIPCTPTFVAGIVSVRGQIYSVLDLTELFGLRGSEQVRRWVLLLQAEGMEMGILVDDVPTVARIARTELQPPLPASSVPAAYVIGIASDAMMLLDVPRILSDPSIIVEEEVPEE